MYDVQFPNTVDILLTSDESTTLTRCSKVTASEKPIFLKSDTLSIDAPSFP